MALVVAMVENRVLWLALRIERTLLSHIGGEDRLTASSGSGHGLPSPPCWQRNMLIIFGCTRGIACDQNLVPARL
jgi:hypothetical protein